MVQFCDILKEVDTIQVTDDIIMFLEKTHQNAKKS